MKTKESIKAFRTIISRPYYIAFSFLLFFIPFVISTNTGELYEFPKTFFLYIYTLILLGIFLTDIVIVPRKVKLPSLLITSFIFINLVTTFLSTHVYTSFWGYYTRFNGGFLSSLMYLVLFIIGINVLTKSEIDRIFKINILAVTLVSLFGISQHFGIPNFIWPYSAEARAFSTFGQPNWLAQYLLIFLPLTLFCFIKEGNKLFWGIEFLVIFSCFWFTYSLSGFISFAIIILLFFWYGLKNRLVNKGNYLKLIVLGVLCFFVAIFNLGIFKGKFIDAYSDLKHRISEVGVVYAEDDTHLVSDPGNIRFGIWKGTLNLIFSSPKIFFIGTGPETFPYTFQSFRPTELNYSSEWDYVMNKPHNYYLQLWSEIGFFGLFAYFVILFRLLRKLPFYYKLGTLGFAITNLFGWPVVATAVIFWLFLIYSEVKA